MSRRTPTPAPLTPPGHLKRFGARIFDDRRNDPYQPSGKYAEPTRCETCGTIYREGRWQWGPAPEGSRSATCPACRRTKDRLPAGLLTLDGEYVGLHRAELVQMARNQAEHERSEHPLQRIMSIDERANHVEIATTDIHLPRRIGEALKRAHDGELAITFGKGEYGVRVRWRR